MIERVRKWLRGTNRRAPEPGDLDPANIPAHVAIIMDGNGRWATRRGLPRVAGHRSGMKAVKRIVMAADKIGVKVLTMYAFSTENWVRPKEEVDFLMKLPQEFFPLEIDELMEKNVQIRMTGWEEHLPQHTIETVRDAIERTKHNTGLILNFALNYGGRRELVHGMKNMFSDMLAGKFSLDQVDEKRFADYLLTRDLPDPDLLIRTSGELRLSNFMLWQLAYSELFFTSVFWPDFSEEHLYEAVYEYQRRTRRYGGL
jgi:undecaprenyl diphosphate synthase